MTRQNNKGFTIIEVVLVLAIAGLIFLIVFLALPQLQRSRRDTQRKNDAGRALAALESYAGNNNGNYPTVAQWPTFVTAYLTNAGGVFGDPTTGTYTLATATPSAEGQIQYAVQSICNGQVAQGGQPPRSVAVVIYQESGGSYCQDNR